MTDEVKNVIPSFEEVKAWDEKVVAVRDELSEDLLNQLPLETKEMVVSNLILGGKQKPDSLLSLIRFTNACVSQVLCALVVQGFVSLEDKAKASEEEKSARNDREADLEDKIDKFMGEQGNVKLPTGHYL